MNKPEQDVINDVSNIDYLGNSPIRISLLAFAQLFSNIYVTKFDTNGKPLKEKRKVQINFAPKSTIVSFLDETTRLPNSNFPELGKRLPFLSFDMTGLSYNNAHQTPATLKHAAFGNPNLQDGKYIYTISPFIFDFQLDIWSKEFQPALEILNQIIPLFRPEVSIKIKTQKTGRMITDIKFIIGQISKTDNYTEGFQNNRLINYNISFKSYFDWPMIIDNGDGLGNQGTLIREIEIDFDWEFNRFQDPIVEK